MKRSNLLVGIGLLAMAGCLALELNVSTASAQGAAARRAPAAAAKAPVAAPVAPKTAPAAPANPAAPAKSAPAEEAAAEAQKLTATTVDGVAIHFTYYKAPGEEAVPVILLHAGGGKGEDLKNVALYLQEKGHAVVVPDLRGHGESTTRTDPATKKETELKAKTQGAKDIAAMALQDMRVVWDFLLRENNQKAVNIKKLCIVGCDMGAIVAVNFAANNYIIPDWRNQPRGKDVKALVLVSPPSAYRGQAYTPAIMQPAFKGEIATLIAVGKQESKETSAAKTLSGTMTKMGETGPKKGDKEKLVQLVELDTKLQGSELLSNAKLKLLPALDGYIQKRLVNKNIPWAKQIVEGE
jgi:pimeloyl-ACP methyl ester carboxylesterase